MRAPRLLCPELSLHISPVGHTDSFIKAFPFQQVQVKWQSKVIVTYLVGGW